MLPGIACFEGEEAIQVNVFLGAPEHQNCLVLDNGATKHIFRDRNFFQHLITLDFTCVIRGIGQEPVRSNQGGIIEDFGKAVYVPDCPANLISFARAREFFTVDYDDLFILTSKTGPKRYIFRGVPPGLYVCNLDEAAAYAHPAVIFSKNERDRAGAARDFHNSMGHPSDLVLRRTVDGNMINNCPITSKDINNAVQVFGPCPHCVMAKMTNHPSKESFRVPSTEVGELVHGDIFYLPDDQDQASPYLIMVDDYSKMLMTTKLPDKSRNTLEAHLLLVQQEYLKANHLFSAIRFDREPAITAMTGRASNDLKCKIHLTCANEHEYMAERNIRTIKDHFRATLLSLPYQLPAKYYEYLVRYVVSSLNMIANSSWNNASPITIFTGKKPEFCGQVIYGFGDVVTAKIPYPEKLSDADGRGEPCIIVGRSAQTEYAYLVAPLNRDTKPVVTRHNIVRMSFIAAINQFGPNPSFIVSHKYGSSSTAARDINNFDIAVSNNSVESGRNSSTTPLSPYANNYVPVSNIAPVVTSQISTNNVTSTPIVINSVDSVSSVAPTRPVAPILPVSPTVVTSTAVTPAVVPTSTVSAPANASTVSGTGVAPTVTAGGVVSSVSTVQSIKPAVISNYNLRRTSAAVQKDYGMHFSVGDAYKFDSDATNKAIDKELKQMKDYNVFEPISPTTNVNSIYSSMVMKDVTHKVIKDPIYHRKPQKVFKARLAAGGDMEQMNYLDNTYAPTVKWNTLLTLAAIHGHSKVIQKWDVTAAFLNADLTNKDIYMSLNPKIVSRLIVSQPEYKRFIRANGSVVVKLKKALYGIKEAGYLWYQKLKSKLLDFGFIMSKVDECLFTFRRGDKYVHLPTHVDDLLCFSNDENLANEVRRHLEKDFGALKVESGTKITYLGVDVIRSSKSESISEGVYQ